MACLCAEQYDDLKAKFDLILELARVVLGMLPSAVTPIIPAGVGAYSKEAKDYVEGLKRRLDDELIELVLQAAVVSGILD